MAKLLPALVIKDHVSLRKTLNTLKLTLELFVAQEELFAGLNCQPGFVCSRSELSQDLRALLQSGLFANVDARVQHKGKGKYTLEFSFSENLWQPIKSFKVRSLLAV